MVSPSVIQGTFAVVALVFRWEFIVVVDCEVLHLLEGKVLIRIENCVVERLPSSIIRL